MVVWGYPCESKSSPAFKYKTPSTKTLRVFFYVKGKRKDEKYHRKEYRLDIGRKITQSLS
jgi:hypothetical protein